MSKQLVLLIIVGVLGMAAEAGAAITKPKHKVHKTTTWSVDAVDAATKTVTLKSSGGGQTIVGTVNAVTKITVNGKVGKLEEVQSGMRAIFIGTAHNLSSLSVTSASSKQGKH
ncbi:MAG: hypothetical protein NTV49_06915 [Kiritimatiellaeota bacterium]|nr:hypothetical protein [Kiritimatiellota bacterium]